MNSKLQHRITQYLTNSMSHADQLLFEADLVSNPELQQEFESFRKVWDLTASIHFHSQESELRWSEFSSSIIDDQRNVYRITTRKYLQFAATILMIAMISYITWFYSTKDTVFIANQQTVSHVLEDQTLVTLNSNSTLTMDYSFNTKHREVRLEGEAAFDVKKNGSPFIIHTSKGDVKVMGTQFKLYTSKYSDLLLIDLYEGQVIYTENGVEYTLNSNDHLMSFNGKITHSNILNTPIDKDYISCKNAPLIYILEQIKNTYGYSYDIPKPYLEESYTLVIPKSNIQDCLKVLNQISSLKFKLKDNTLTLE